MIKLRAVLLLISIFLLSITGDVYASLWDKEKNAGVEPFITTLTLPGSDIVYIVLSFHTGSVRDPRGKEGLNYVTARLIEEKIERALDKDAQESGAYLSAQTEKELTTFFFKVHRDRLKEAYSVFITGITRPQIDTDSLQRSVAQATNYRDRISRHGESLALAALELFIYRNHPYGTPDFGTEKSLGKLTVEDVKDFFYKHYTRENYELGVAGRDCGEIKKQVKHDLDSLPPGKPDKVVIGTPESSKRNKVMIVRKEGTASDVALGFPVSFTRADDDYYPLLIANAYFGQHRYLNCFLSRKLRTARGFNYGNYSYIEKFREGRQDKMPGVRIPRSRQYFYIWIRSLAKENAFFAAKLALHSFNQMLEKGLSEEYFMIMRDFLKYNSRLWAFDPFQKLGFLMDSNFYQIPYFISYIETKMKTITNNDVSSALKRRFAQQNAKIVFVTDDPETLKGRLLGIIDDCPVYKSMLPKEELTLDKQVMKFDFGLAAEDIEIVEVEDLF